MPAATPSSYLEVFVMTGNQCGRLLIGATGSIHVIDLPQYLPKFRESFCDAIDVLMTDTAAAMYSPRVVSLYADSVSVGWWGDSPVTTPHIQLTRSCDLFVVLPATANTLCKVAAGIADTPVTAAVAASPQPVVFAPAMNARAWESRPVQRAISQLREDGHYVVDPEPAFALTEGQEDGGRAPSPGTLMAHLKHVLSRRQAAEYFAEATSEPPRTPAAQKLLPTVALPKNGSVDA
jgi:phosphopantothenoylcysteine synthetase/decarboxylase